MLDLVLPPNNDAETMRAILKLIYHGHIVRLRMTGGHVSKYVVTFDGFDVDAFDTADFGEWDEAAQWLIDKAESL